MNDLLKNNLAVESYREFILEAQAMNTPAVSDSLVAKAIDFIKNNANKQIQVSDVVNHVSVSRRELERRFKKSSNRSIHREIKLTKVQLISKILLGTSDNISVIAAKLGFADVAHIARYFKDIEGISPLKYRRKNSCAGR
ncbi:MAG: AraC family transcriptional regulator [Sedimentisphaerales bacterium]|jgi:LacI family transcriptional regulator